tara:strand:- start:3201 stop:3890 length:690 start_codon:yes stop_codon:yes gene_type:complete
MTALDWLWILHPALAVVVVYPLLGVVMSLAWQTRQRRVAKQKHPPTVGRDHSDVGRWLAASVVWLVLIALAVSIASKVPLADFAGGVTRAAQLLVVLLGTSASLIALWRCQAAVFRFSFSVLTFIGVLALGAQPEVWRVSDDLFSSGFWQSHYWSGVAVTGLMLLSLSARREITRDLRVRRLHVTASILAAVLFLMQGVTGTRDLLEIPLSWQKPAVYRCDFVLQTCPS